MSIKLAQDIMGAAAIVAFLIIIYVMPLVQNFRDSPQPKTKKQTLIELGLWEEPKPEPPLSRRQVLIRLFVAMIIIEIVIIISLVGTR